MNRLQYETSPYLLQHATNPVDWYPWGDEAFERALREDKPILLSVGYSACHWCHVMAHESFEHEPTAQMMNELFVNIKVDREERPDVDDIYMQAVQAMSQGHGGWPMTVFLLPDGRPFYGGTYFPLEPRYGIPSFRQVLQGVAEAYRERRAAIEQSAESLTQSLDRELLGISPDDAGLNPELLDAALERIGKSYDRVHGGFGGAPKFPQPMALEFLLRGHARTGAAEPLEMVTNTLRKMARGGIYDQIGGGFHRYSVDAIWLVPHFEKMLYDNAQLSRVYLHAWQITRDPFFKRIAEEIYDYILREMTAPDGGFYSTTDADSEGEEGRFFVWSKDALEELLGEDAQTAIEYWGVTARGNFEGHNILYLPNDDEIIAQRLDASVEALRHKISAIRDKLYAARAQRPHPNLDDKIITAWNGMMLASLSEAARAFDREDYRQAALRNAAFLIENMVTEEGRLLRTCKDGKAKINGYLEDYAHLVDGFLELYQTTFDERWFAEAQQLADVVLARFRADDGGFFDTSDDHEVLIVRPRNLQDNATPAGNSIMARGLIRLAAYTGDADYEEAARSALHMLTAAMREYPLAFGEALGAIDMLVDGLAEIAVVGDPAQAETRALLDVVQKRFSPNTIVALSAEPQGSDAVIPLLSDRIQRGDAPTVYVCRHFACKMPVTTPEAFELLLKSDGADD